MSLRTVCMPKDVSPPSSAACASRCRAVLLFALSVNDTFIELVYRSPKRFYSKGICYVYQN